MSNNMYAPRQQRPMNGPRGIPPSHRGGHQTQNIHPMGTSPQAQAMHFPPPQQQPGAYTIMNLPGQPMINQFQQPAQIAHLGAGYPGYYQQQIYLPQPTAAGQSQTQAGYTAYAHQYPQHMAHASGAMATQQAQTSQGGAPGRPPSQPGMAGIPINQAAANQAINSQMSQGYNQKQSQPSAAAAASQMQHSMAAAYINPAAQQPPYLQQTQPTQLTKRERKPLAIINPDTHETVNKEQLGESTASTSNTSTPPPPGDRHTPETQAINSSSSSSSQSSSVHTASEKASQPHDDEVKNKFRAQVLQAKLGGTAESQPAAKVTLNGTAGAEPETKAPSSHIKPVSATPQNTTSVSGSSKEVEVSVNAASPVSSPRTVKPAAATETKTIPAQGEKAETEEKSADTMPAVAASTSETSEVETKTSTPAPAVTKPATESPPPPPTTTETPADSDSKPSSTAVPAQTDLAPRAADEDKSAEAVTGASAVEQVDSVQEAAAAVVEVKVTSSQEAEESKATTPADERPPPTESAAVSDSKPEEEIVSTESKTTTSPPTPASNSTTVTTEASKQSEEDTKLMPPPQTPVVSSSKETTSTPPADTDKAGGKENKENKTPSQPQETTKPQSSQPLTTPTTAAAAGPSLAPSIPAVVTAGLKGSKSMVADMHKVADKYKYREDPMRPLDPEGKKTYDRDFLLSLQKADASKMKPEGLVNILNEIMLAKPLGDSRVSAFSAGRKSDVFSPDYIKPAQSPRTSMSKKSLSREQTRVGSRQGGAAVITYKREQNVQLKRSENAWKPGDKLVGADKSEDEKVHEELLKNFRGMLNKITPQKFQTILTKILMMPVKSERDLAGVMNLVFEKAIAEPGFSVTYASLCQNLAKEFKVPSEEDANVEVSFRKLLLVRCQREFEKSNADDEEMVTKKAALDKASAEEKGKLQEEFELFETKARRRKLGNIRFIGELFKLQMLVPKIMHDCVISLLKGTDEESYECLCRLLTTIGKELDTEKAKPRTDQYFAEMRKIANNQSHKKVSSRIKFALQDVIELRESNWKPRRENNNPKTIKEIHAEAALEAHERQMAVNQAVPNRGSQGRIHPPNRPMRGGDDGWNQVGGVIKTQRIDPSKMKLTKTTFGSSDVQLGPGGGLGASAGWGKGSSGSGKNTPPQQAEDRPNTPTNRFSALMGGDRDGGRDERSRSGQRLPHGRNSMGRGSAGPRGMGRNITPRSSMEKDRSSALAAARQFSRPGMSGPGSRGASRENSVEGRGMGSGMRTPTPTRQQNLPGARATPTPQTAAAVKQLSRSEWETKMASILDELLHNKDTNEAIECVKELGAQTSMDLLTECSLNHVLERSTQARKTTGQLMGELIKQGLLPVNDHLKGLNTVLELADDLAIDIPNVWQYFGELIAPTFMLANVPLNRLEDICKPLVSIGKSGTLAAAILEEASHSIGHIELGKRWNDAKMKWSNLLSAEENESEFIKSNKLEYTLTDSTAEGMAASRQTSQEDVNQTLHKLIISESAPNETVFDWIDGNLSSEKRSEQSFIRSLTTTVIKACIRGEEMLEEKFKNRAPILMKYYDNKADRELCALTALEELMDQLQHPSKLLSDLCYALSEDELISDDSFFVWEKTSTNGIAIKSVTQFFQWLRTE